MVVSLLEGTFEVKATARDTHLGRGMVYGAWSMVEYFERYW
jgi:hypothetical protein